MSTDIRRLLTLLESIDRPAVSDQLLAALVEWDLNAQNARVKARRQLEKTILTLAASLPKPVVSGTLYRGTGLTIMDEHRFRTTGSVTLQSPGMLSSWSRSKELATSFAEDLYYENRQGLQAVVIAMPATGLDLILDVTATANTASPEQTETFDLHVLQSEDEILVRNTPLLLTPENTRYFNPND